MPDPDFTHLFLVARLAIERGDRKPAERLLSQNRTQAKWLEDNPGGTVELRGSRSWWRTRYQKQTQKVAAMLANGAAVDASQLPTGIGPNPWAEAHKLRHHDNPVINFALTDSQIQAAVSIHKIFEETTRALSIWHMPLDSIQVDTSKWRKDAWLSMPGWALDERINVYVPWLSEWGKVQAIKRPHQTLSATELTMLIVIDGHSVRAIGRSWKADPKRLRRSFRQALDGYAKIKRVARQERDIVEGGL